MNWKMLEEFCGPLPLGRRELEKVTPEGRERQTVLQSLLGPRFSRLTHHGGIKRTQLMCHIRYGNPMFLKQGPTRGIETIPGFVRTLA